MLELQHMKIKEVDASKIRFNLGEAINLAYYGGTQVRINRNKKPMARLISEPFMIALEQLFKSEPDLEKKFKQLLDEQNSKIGE